MTFAPPPSILSGENVKMDPLFWGDVSGRLRLKHIFNMLLMMRWPIQTKWWVLKIKMVQTDSAAALTVCQTVRVSLKQNAVLL